LQNVSPSHLWCRALVLDMPGNSRIQREIYQCSRSIPKRSHWVPGHARHALEYRGGSGGKDHIGETQTFHLRPEYCSSSPGQYQGRFRTNHMQRREAIKTDVQVGPCLVYLFQSQINWSHPQPSSLFVGVIAEVQKRTLAKLMQKLRKPRSSQRYEYVLWQIKKPCQNEKSGMSEDHRSWQKKSRLNLPFFCAFQISPTSPCWSDHNKKMSEQINFWLPTQMTKGITLDGAHSIDS